MIVGWQPIQSITLTDVAASVTFSGIPQTYKTLKVLVSARTDRNTSGQPDSVDIQFNGDTANNYTVRNLRGDGTGTPVSATTAINVLTRIYADSAVSTANTFTNFEVTIPNYTGSTQKPISIDAVQEDNGNITYAYNNLIAGIWTGTTAITSIKLIPGAGTNLVFGSTFSLYGIA